MDAVQVIDALPATAEVAGLLNTEHCSVSDERAAKAKVAERNAKVAQPVARDARIKSRARVFSYGALPMQNVDLLSNLLRSMQLVELAPRLERGIPRWPTHPHFILDPTMTHAHDGYYCQSLGMPEHLGCHCDAPAHALADGMDRTIDCIPARHLIAPAVVYDFSCHDLQAGELIDASLIEQMERDWLALVNFGWLARHWRTDDRAQWCATNSPGG